MARHVVQTPSSPPVSEIAGGADPQPARLPSGQNLPQSATLESFVRSEFGVKHRDQAGGFIFWAKKAGHVRHSVAEWRALLRDFNSSPIGKQER